MPYTVTKAAPLSQGEMREMKRRFCLALLETLYAEGFLTCAQKQFCIERENDKYQRMQQKEISKP